MTISASLSVAMQPFCGHIFMILAELALLKATNLEAVDFSLNTNSSQRMARVEFYYYNL